MNWVVDHMNEVYFVSFCILIGIEVISNVPSIMHTPLMSGSNAISGVITIGAILMLLRVDSNDYLNLTLGGLSVLLGAINVSGGFLVTHRMLKMFKSKNSL